MKRRHMLLILMVLLLLGACQRTATEPTASPPSANATVTVAEATEGPADTPVAPPTASTPPPVEPTATSLAQGTATPNAVVNPDAAYLDDRSDAVALLDSYVSALNRREFGRAYSYWSPTAPALPRYDQFADGYAETASVAIDVGTVLGDAGAGQLYYSAPVAYSARTMDGGEQYFAACYILRLSQPGIQGVPFRSLAIERARATEVPSMDEAISQRDGECTTLGGGGEAVEPYSGAPDDVSAARYLDDRTDAVALLRSYANALNRKEYARAYSYWQQGMPSLAPFEEFEAGYQQTDQVVLTTGTPQVVGDAGNLSAFLPVAMDATLDDGTRQLYVGCYVTSLPGPVTRLEPPFDPLAIVSASVQEVPADTDPETLLPTACDN